MIKKNDLAKQFELLTKQEIKNYQDSLDFVLQSIREIRDEIKEVQKESLANHAKIHSFQVELQGKFEILKDSCVSIESRFGAHIRDQTQVNVRNQTQIESLISDIIKKMSFDINFKNKIDDVCIRIRRLQSQSDLNYKNLNSSDDNLLRRFTSDIEKTKKEIREVPSDAFIVKKQLEEQICAHKVDVTGIMKEINIFKKENYITQKKIENIYTLIDRLKKSEVLV